MRGYILLASTFILGVYVGRIQAQHETVKNAYNIIIEGLFNKKEEKDEKAT